MDSLKVVIICQFFTSHDPARPGKQSHSRLSTNGPLDHFAIGLAGMIYKSCDRASSSIYDHLVVEAHKVVTLFHISLGCHTIHLSYLVLLIDLFHTPFTLRLRDDLAGIFNNDLMGLEGPHCPYTVTTAVSLHDLNTIIIAIPFAASLELCKGAVATFLCCKSTVRAVAFIRHDTIVAGFSASIFWITIALRRILFFAFPQCRRITNKSVYVNVRICSWDEEWTILLESFTQPSTLTFLGRGLYVSKGSLK